MSETIAKQIHDLKRMSVGELRLKYREVYGEDTRSGNKNWLWKRIAWRIQELSYGSLSERANRRASEIADEADLRMRVPKNAFDAALKGMVKVTGALPQDKRIPMPGTAINRVYKGKMYTVTILDKGFEYDGKTYKTLSAVAKCITGTHWNGFKFFDL